MKLSELLQFISGVAKNIGASPPWICGGLPRDRVMKRFNDFNDVDITTGDETIHALAKELSIKLKSSNVHYSVMDDGHARIGIGDFKMDFSSNFNTPGIEKILAAKNIINPNSLQKEIYSRDFTCNTLLMNMDLKKIIDPTGFAIKDINQKILRTCLSPEITLGYDPKRIVRIMYLSSKLKFNVDKSIILWVKNNSNILKTVKSDYIVKKIQKSFNYNKGNTVYLLNEMNLWSYIPPSKELSPDILRNLTRTK